MRVFKIILLVVLGLITGGFGLCGAWGVLADWQNYMEGCKGRYACLGWGFGWIGLGIAAVGGLLLWLVHRFMSPRPGAAAAKGQGPSQP